jgi:hypothetical protein
VHVGFWLGNLRERDHLEDQIDLAQDRDKWQFLVNVMVNLWVP